MIASSEDRRRFDAGIALARQRLAAARLGLADYRSGDPQRALLGLENAITLGRSVTFVMQTALRRWNEGKFNAWYAPREQVMRQDPLLAFMVNVRNTIEKQGVNQLGSVTITLGVIDHGEIRQAVGPPPPGATEMFIGDPNGRSGWIIPQPDGAESRYYTTLSPGAQFQVGREFAAPPTSHLGTPVADTSPENLVTLYLDYLGRLIDQAETDLGSP